jgi:hypothetical protein
MSNNNTLLSIESNFLAQTSVKDALRLTAYNQANRNELNGAKKLFEISMTKAHIVADGSQWWDAQGKTTATEQGIAWNKEEFYSKVYGCQKSFAAKLQKAAKVEAEKLQEFKTICDSLESEGKKSKRSIAGLLAWVKDGSLPTNETEVGEGEGEGEGESEAVTTILTLSYKGGDKNVAVRIASDGTMTTTNTPEQIRQAIALLEGALANA